MLYPHDAGERLVLCCESDGLDNGITNSASTTYVSTCRCRHSAPTPAAPNHDHHRPANVPYQRLHLQIDIEAGLIPATAGDDRSGGRQDGVKQDKIGLEVHLDYEQNSTNARCRMKVGRWNEGHRYFALLHLNGEVEAKLQHQIDLRFQVHLARSSPAKRIVSPVTEAGHAQAGTAAAVMLQLTHRYPGNENEFLHSLDENCLLIQVSNHRDGLVQKVARNRRWPI